MNLISEHKMSLGEIILGNEEVITGKDKNSVLKRLDNIVEAMLETGRDMSTKYKETSEGGLAAVCSAIC